MKAGFSGAGAGAKRKAQIIEAANRLFHARGYHMTSLDDIADAVGFTKPAIYYYFRSKDDILFAIVDRIIEGALQRIRLIANREGLVAERLFELLRENTLVVIENIESNTVFYNSRRFLTPQREQDVREREREYTGVFRSLWIEGVRAGELKDLDPSVATATLLGASIWVYTWFDPEGRLPKETACNEIAELLMSGVRA